MQDIRKHYSFTVFTPTYNRIRTLPRVYESLKKQTFRDFEWLIVDDGSTDDTEVTIRKWQAAADFPIRYLWQENSGKPMAVNRGVREARGEFFLILDSDDACVPETLERFKFHWDSIPRDRKCGFVGVTCLSRDPSGKVVGKRFPSNPTDSNSLEMRLKHRVKGEKWGFQRTDILKQFPNPVVENERFITESIVWNRIALRYQTRYVNEALRIYWRSREGIGTALARIQNCKSARFYYRELVSLRYPIPFGQLLRNYANYARYSWHAGMGLGSQIKDVPSVLHWVTALPVGYLLYWKDRSFEFTSN